MSVGGWIVCLLVAFVLGMAFERWNILGCEP